VNTVFHAERGAVRVHYWYDVWLTLKPIAAAAAAAAAAANAVTNAVTTNTTTAGL
jgi:hypothetical protein